jgi:hypothetical protein
MLKMVKLINRFPEATEGISMVGNITSRMVPGFIVDGIQI